jgi:DNA adenine methylase
MIEPIFKWTGGKGRMRARYDDIGFFPTDYTDFTQFVDLFAGACGVSCWIANDYPTVPLVINDINAEIIAMYREMATNYPSVEKHFTSIIDSFLRVKDRKKFYNNCKEAYCFHPPKDKAFEAAMLLFMLKTNFNGIWKNYKKYGGRYSTPPGMLQQKESSFDVPAVGRFAQMLGRATIYCCSYEQVPIATGAWVYADPPYRGGVVEYQTGFSDAEQLKLAQHMASLAPSRLIAESNRDFKDGFWTPLFPTPPFYIHEFETRYTAGRGTTVTEAHEVLITNYKHVEPSLV